MWHENPMPYLVHFFCLKSEVFPSAGDAFQG